MATGSGTGTPVSGVETPYEALPYFTAVWVWDNSASAYIDNTIEARSFGGTAFTILEDTNDWLYLGSQSRFDLAAFEQSVAGSLSGLVWQFYGSSGFTQFVPSNSLFNIPDGPTPYDFSSDGAENFDNLVGWTPLAFSATSPHVATPPDTTTRYWIRVRATTISTAPTINRIICRPYAIYATPTDVANILQLDNDFSSTTTPTRATVEDYIHAAQATIDFKTNKSWRLNYKIAEPHEFNISGFRLDERDVIRIASLKVWDGGSWETKTQGRTGDYFCVPDMGMVYFARFFLLPARLQSYHSMSWTWGWAEFIYPVLVSYFYGKNIYASNKDGGVVQDLAKKMAAIDVLQSHDYSILVVSGTDKITLERKVQNWKEEIEEKLDSLRSWVVF